MELDQAHQGKAFFSCLRSLCRYVDNETAALKRELSLPPGSKPENYDKGLRSIQKDLENLKNSNADVKEKFASLQNFSSYVNSMQELVAQQTADVDRIESYLKKFGYVPIPKVEVPDADGGSSVSDKENSHLDQMESPVLKGSPVLSEVAIKVLRGQQLDIIAPPPSAAKSKVEGTTLREQISVSSYNSSTSREQQPLEENIELTPHVLRVPRINMPDEQGSQMLYASTTSDCVVRERKDTFQTPVKDTNDVLSTLGNCTPTPSLHQRESLNIHSNLPSTPCEPEMSEYTMQLFNMMPSVQRKEQETGEINKQLLAYHNNVSSDTHYEEPRLASKAVHEPREPQVLHHMTEIQSSLIGNNTPEEPLLSYQASNDCNENYSPEEPIMSYKSQGMVSRSKDPVTPPTCSWKERRVVTSSVYGGVDEDMPPSPELSEVTMSLLHIKKSSIQPQNPKLHQEIDTRSYRSLQNSHSRVLYTDSPQEKIPWHSKGMAMEEFFGHNEDLPSTPQMSDVTQKIFWHRRK